MLCFLLGIRYIAAMINPTKQDETMENRTHSDNLSTLYIN